MRGRTNRFMLVAVSGWLALVPAAVAQVAGTAASSGPRAAAPDRPAALCFRGGPPSRCQNFLIVEAGISQLVRGGPAEAESTLGTGEVGFMHNAGPRYAWGLTFFFGQDEDSRRFGPQVRFRYWLSGTGGNRVPLSLDASLGAYVNGTRTYLRGYTEWEPCPGCHGRQPVFSEVRYPSPTLGLAFNVADWFSIGSHIEYIRFKGGGGQHAAYVFLRAGSYAGIVGVVILIASAIAQDSLASTWM